MQINQRVFSLLMIGTLVIGLFPLQGAFSAPKSLRDALKLKTSQIRSTAASKRQALREKLGRSNALTDRYVVPYSCGSDVSANWVSDSTLSVKSYVGNAGFNVYTSFNGAKLPFQPVRVAFNLTGDVRLDDYFVVTWIDTNDVSHTSVQVPFGIGYFEDQPYSINTTFTGPVKMITVRFFMTTGNPNVRWNLNNFDIGLTPRPSLDLVHKDSCP